MAIFKHPASLLGFLFSLAVLYYNFSYDFNNANGYGYGSGTTPHFSTIPRLNHSESKAEQKRIFTQYLTMLVTNDNAFLQKMHDVFLKTHQQFIRTHKLSYLQIFWLNYLYSDARILDLYQKSTWLRLLQQTDITPQNALEHYSTKNTLNPLDIKQFHTSCIWDSTLLSNLQPWIQAPRCYIAQQLLTLMQKPNLLIHPKKFSSLTAAYRYFIFSTNLSPAYRQFRNIRARWRKKHPDNISWTMQSNIDTLNPQRMNDEKYYRTPA